LSVGRKIKFDHLKAELIATSVEVLVASTEQYKIFEVMSKFLLHEFDLELSLITKIIASAAFEVQSRGDIDFAYFATASPTERYVIGERMRIAINSKFRGILVNPEDGIKLDGISKNALKHYADNFALR